MDYHIIKISRNKKQYLDLLLLGDEQETMIDRYLERGDLFVLEDNGIKAVGVVTKEGPEICELKNIAVTPIAQRQGYGRKLINYLINHYSKEYTQMIVGTGDVPGVLAFYKSCGFEYSHCIKGFFTRLDQGGVHSLDALIDGDNHDQERGDEDDGDLTDLAYTQCCDDQEHIGQRGDVADKLNPGLHHVAKGVIPRHEERHRDRYYKRDGKAGQHTGQTGPHMAPQNAAGGLTDKGIHHSFRCSEHQWPRIGGEQPDCNSNGQ